MQILALLAIILLVLQGLITLFAIHPALGLLVTGIIGLGIVQFVQAPDTE